MSVWAKVLHDGSLSIGATVTAPGFTLTAGSVPQDGWVEYADETAALAAFGVTDDPVGVLQGQVAQLSAQLAALLGEDVTP
jgi:hypothetical protein